MSENWNNPQTQEIHLSNGQVIPAEINGKSLDGLRGSIFNDGDPLDVVLVDGQWREKGYTPTPADEALYLTLLTSQVCLSVQNEYAGGNFADLETYNRMYAIARKVDVQARKLFDIVEKQAEGEEEARQLRIANGMEQ